MIITKTTSQRIELIALADCAPAGYQRLTSPTHVSKIVQKFDEAKLGVLTVSLRGGNYYIIDGLHRSAALKILGYSHTPCVVLTGMTYEQEADFFRKQNENKRVLATLDDFKSGLEAKDETCLKINDIVKANNFSIGKGNSFYKIASVQGLYTIVKDYGYEVLDDTLCLLANTWSEIPKASQYECLLGVAEFVSRYGFAEFSERLRNKFVAVFYDYAETMRVQGCVGTTTSRKKFCRALVIHYNQGLRGNSKRRLIWED